MKQEKYLVADESQKTFETEEELREYLKFRKDNDILIKIPINELSATGVDNIPLFIPERLAEIEAVYRGVKFPVVPISYDEIEVRECIESTGIFLCIPYTDSKHYALPTTDYGYGTLLQRIDDFCGTMVRTEPKTQKNVLPASEKGVRITRDMELYKSECLILLRDKKVRAVHSKVFDWLDNEELINTFENVMETDNPNLKFRTAQVNHEYLLVDYALDNELVEESIKFMLNDHGANIRDLKAGVRFITSDIGMSAVRANIVLTIDGSDIMLNGIAMEHKGGATIEKWETLLNDHFAQLLKEQEERIEVLGNTDIANIPFVVKEITDNNVSIFPSKISEEVIQELEIKFPITVGGTAIDCYLALNEIINRHYKNNKLSIGRYLMLADKVASMINLPYDRIEKGGFFK